MGYPEDARTVSRRFVCHYLDLFTTYYSLYNSVMKILYIVSTGYIVYMIRYKVRLEPVMTIVTTRFFTLSLGLPYGLFSGIDHACATELRHHRVLWTFYLPRSCAIIPQQYPAAFPRG